ncbi:MAG: ChbG/HpnK family deacetylase [Legionella sp.]|nr:ChbG/HpnK family deacetylase [Legionella sp.]
MPHLKPIHLCADDFGLNPGVSRGILTLIEHKRISATSCMVNMPGFKSHASALLDLRHSVRVGLHFNLTEGQLLTGGRCFGLKELLIKSHIRNLDSSKITQEFHHQLDSFVQIMGFLPNFIDGHQHVHQFPLIRTLILNYYAAHLQAHNIAIRSTFPTVHGKAYKFKTHLMAWTGGRALQAQLKKRHIPHNPYFAGIYDFTDYSDYPVLFRQWLAETPAHSLIMCHPGEPSSQTDIISITRKLEMDYLMSEPFLKDCQDHQVRIGDLPTSPDLRYNKTVSRNQD